MLPALDLRLVHVIGVCGTLMGAFAAFLRRQGVRVTGSDQNTYPPMSDVLRAAGVELFEGFRVENLTATGSKPDLVVIGNVISSPNPEARAAIDGGMNYCSLPGAMEKLILEKTRNFVVAGTHGKTTTSSLLAHVLVRSGRDPGYFIGGVPADLPHSFHVPPSPEGKPFVLEGDEYDTAFWDKVPKFNHYLPDETILTSIEYDHADIYPDLASVVRAFEGLVERIRPGGHLIVCADYPEALAVSRLAKVPVATYGSPGADFSIANLATRDDRTSFEVVEGNRSVARLSLGLSGRHNALNALAVWIQARRIGIGDREIADSIASFRGVKRRQEERGELAGVLVIDDFAHHPTAVRATLEALRSRYPRRPITAVFEPRSATSRRKVFQAQYASAFDSADRIVISQPHLSASLPAADQFSSHQLVEDLRSQGKDAHLMPEIDAGAKELGGAAKPGELIAVLSNGGFGGFIQKLLSELSRRG